MATVYKIYVTPEMAKEAAESDMIGWSEAILKNADLVAAVNALTEAEEEDEGSEENDGDASSEKPEASESTEGSSDK